MVCITQFLNICYTMKFSEEQSKIVHFWSEKENELKHIVVNAKAGSGKSTVSIGCADILYSQSKSKTLILTFSSLLKIAGRNKSIKHVQFESYHSAVSNIFGFPCVDSYTLNMFLQCSDVKPIKSLRRFKLLVIDEAQDLTEEYVKLIGVIRPFLAVNHRVLLVGDRFQSIFQAIMNSSCKYMDNPTLYFGGTFVNFQLNTTFRLTWTMCDWINKYLNPNQLKLHYPKYWDEEGVYVQESWGNGIMSAHTISKYTTVDEICFDFSGKTIPGELLVDIQTFVDSFGSDSVLLIVHSCRFTVDHPVHRILDSIRNCDWVILSDEVPMNELVISSKGVVATAYKMKGREYRLVVNFGLDDTLEKHDISPILAFSIAYVSCTRATDKLIVVRDSRVGKFFTMRTEAASVEKNRQTSVTTLNLVRYLPFDNSMDVLSSTLESRQPRINVSDIAPGKQGTTESIRFLYQSVIDEVLEKALQGESAYEWDTVICNILSNSRRKPITRQINTDLLKLNTVLNKIMHSIMELLDSKFSSKQYRLNVKVRYGRVMSTIPIVFDDIHHVHFSWTNSIEYYQLLNSVLSSAVGHDDTRTTYSYVLNPIRGELRMVKTENVGKRELLSTVLKKKKLQHMQSLRPVYY